MTRPVRLRSVLDVMGDVFAAAFAGPSWRAWRAALAAIFALPLSEAEGALYRRCTGRQALPVAPAREAWLIVGRRGGKSRIAALLAVFLACFRKYHLAPGERGVVMVIATDRRQARVVYRYVVALLEASPMLRPLIVGEPRKDGVDLRHGVSIEIHTSSFRAVRGYTVVGAICDEIAFWPTEDAAEPDTEILNALRPAMATIPEALLVAISSPYARRGQLWKAYQRHHGRDGDLVLTWQADSATMNPELPAGVIAAAYADDEASARAEYGATFRTDLEALVSREAVEACTVADRFELPPVSGMRYAGFVDPSGGSADSMTLAIGHLERDRAVLDVVREVKPPFSPEAVVDEFAGLLRAYRISTVTGDHYGGEWPRERFSKCGVTYRPSDLSRSDLYLALVPMLNSGRVELLAVPRLASQLVALERRTARGGRDLVDHAPGGHDDLANAVAGVLVHLLQGAAEPGFLGYLKEQLGRVPAAETPAVTLDPATEDEEDARVLQHQTCRIAGVRQEVLDGEQRRCAKCFCKLGTAIPNFQPVTAERPAPTV